MISLQDEKISSSSSSSSSSPSSSSSITTIGLLSLPPDVWSECLSYLPPNELSRNAQLICKNLSGKEVAERAAWITVKSIVGVAHRISSVITTKIDDETTATAAATATRPRIEIDTEAAEVQRLLLNDRTIIGDVIRKSSSSNNNNNNKQMDQKEKETNSYRGDIFRFQDETWEDLYALVHYVLSTNRNDHESYALVIGLIFNSPALPKRLTDQKRQKLASIARDCSSYITNRGATPDSNNSLSGARYSLISLRLGSAGLWDIASNILQSHSSSATTGDPESSCSVLSIDSMIYSSTFLIDRLYSQTYVRKNNEDDINDLVNAVCIGRKAVEMAKKRYDIFYEKQIVATSCEEDKSRCGDDGINQDDPNNYLLLLLPRPPIESLFANDVFRYVYARLALAKAVTLLAQHIGLGATDISSLDMQQVLPGSITREEIRQLNGYTSYKQQCYNYSMYFMNEANEQYTPIQSTFRLNKKYWSCQSESDVISLKAATGSGNGEFCYCLATIESTFEFDPDSEISPLIAAKTSFEQFANAFRLLMFRILRKNIDFDDKVTEIIVQCAKDLGKVCSFAQERIGIIDVCDKQGRNVDPGMFRDFAYIFSIYQNGSYHPTSKNIKELDRREESDIGTISDRYNRIVPWLIDEYYNNDGVMTWFE